MSAASIACQLEEVEDLDAYMLPMLPPSFSLSDVCLFRLATMLTNVGYMLA
jgi:hypothetical protein